LISTLATTTPATRSDTPTRRTVEAVAAPATTIAVTTGASLGHAHETPITMTHLRSDAGLEKTGKGQTDTSDGSRPRNLPERQLEGQFEFIDIDVLEHVTRLCEFVAALHVQPWQD
jgi:hypothetical protein